MDGAPKTPAERGGRWAEPRGGAGAPPPAPQGRRGAVRGRRSGGGWQWRGRRRRWRRAQAGRWQGRAGDGLGVTIRGSAGQAPIGPVGGEWPCHSTATCAGAPQEGPIPVLGVSAARRGRSGFAEIVGVGVGSRGCVKGCAAPPTQHPPRCFLGYAHPYGVRSRIGLSARKTEATVPSRVRSLSL